MGDMGAGDRPAGRKSPEPPVPRPSSFWSGPLSRGNRAQISVSLLYARQMNEGLGYLSPTKIHWRQASIAPRRSVIGRHAAGRYLFQRLLASTSAAGGSLRRRAEVGAILNQRGRGVAADQSTGYGIPDYGIAVRPSVPGHLGHLLQELPRIVSVSSPETVGSQECGTDSAPVPRRTRWDERCHPVRWTPPLVEHLGLFTGVVV